jgi:protein-S-isoprenylcysteine O-methyltransferase Ste14
VRSPPRGLVSYVLACATGITLYFRWPFPEDDLILRLISIRAPLIYVGFNAALGVFALSASPQTWAMVVTPFFSPVVRLQPERGHRIVTHGPYRFMRHPGYFAMSIAISASALAIGSWIALAPAAGFVACVLVGMNFEDEFLKENLRGYKVYATRVRNRIIPQLPIRQALSPEESSVSQTFAESVIHLSKE